MGSMTTTTSTSKPKQWILGDKFDARSPHHDSLGALWEKKWKFPCAKSLYPFHDGRLEDFTPIFSILAKSPHITSPYTETYTQTFFPQAKALTQRAASAPPAEASLLYLRAAAVYRIARFPLLGDSAAKAEAWAAQKRAYMAAVREWVDPVVEVGVPFVGARGSERGEIPVYVRVPSAAAAAKGGKGVPVVLLITGLDGYRPDNTQRLNEFVKRGWGTVVVEIPGTGDCPVDPADVGGMERLWESVFKWMGGFGGGVFDMGRVVVWGLSMGAYYAVRVAHTHKGRLRGCVAQGAGVHHFFGREWLGRVDGHEYPFEITPALAQKFGYGSDMQAFMEGAQKKLSLVESGVVDKPSCRLLLVNGTHDGLMPIEDSMLLFEHASPKEARFFSQLLHMGYPDSNASVYPWLDEVLAE